MDKKTWLVPSAGHGWPSVPIALDQFISGIAERHVSLIVQKILPKEGK